MWRWDKNSLVIKKMVRLWKKEKTILFFLKEEVVLVLDNKREREMWSWEKKTFFFFFFFKVCQKLGGFKVLILHVQPYDLSLRNR